MAAPCLTNDLTGWINQLAKLLDRRVSWRLLPMLTGLLFATGRRTVSSWSVGSPWHGRETGHINDRPHQGRHRRAGWRSSSAAPEILLLGGDGGLLRWPTARAVQIAGCASKAHRQTDKIKSAIWRVTQRAAPCKRVTSLPRAAHPPITPIAQMPGQSPASICGICEICGSTGFFAPAGKHGTSTAGMPPLLAYEGADGTLEL